MRKREMIEQLDRTKEHAEEIKSSIGCSGLPHVSADTVYELVAIIIALTELVKVNVEEQWSGPY